MTQSRDPKPDKSETQPAETPAEADDDMEALQEQPPAGQYGPTADFGDG